MQVPLLEAEEEYQARTRPLTRGRRLAPVSRAAELWFIGGVDPRSL
jgi:hypothetical protein